MAGTESCHGDPGRRRARWCARDGRQAAPWMSWSLLRLNLEDVAIVPLKRSQAEASPLASIVRAPHLSPRRAGRLADPARPRSRTHAAPATRAKLQDPLWHPHRFSTKDCRLGSGGQGQIPSGKIPARAHVYTQRDLRWTGSACSFRARKRKRENERSPDIPWSLPSRVRDTLRACPRARRS